MYHILYLDFICKLMYFLSSRLSDVFTAIFCAWRADLWSGSLHYYSVHSQHLIKSTKIRIWNVFNHLIVLVIIPDKGMKSCIYSIVLYSIICVCVCLCSAGSGSGWEPAGRSDFSHLHSGLVGSPGSCQRPHPKLPPPLVRDINR